MQFIVYGMVAIMLIAAFAALATYKKKKYPGLLLFSGMLIALASLSIYLLHFYE